MEEDNFLDRISQSETALSALISCNEYTKKFGITISREDALELLLERKNTLKENGRVEFGEGILNKLIFAFCDSPYIYQDNYLDTLEQLQEIFYIYKNESLDDVTDEELLDYMKEHYDGDCQGSLEYLEETCLEEFARSIREGTRKFIGRKKNNDT